MRANISIPRSFIYKLLFIAVWIVLPLFSAQGQDIRVQYNNQQTSFSSSEIKPYIKLFNDSGQTLNLTDVTIRYWFTSEPPGQDVFVVDWAELGTSAVTGTFGTIGGNRYLETGFTSSAQIPGYLGGGAANEFPASSNTGPIQQRIHDDGWASYDQTNDYSFDESITNYADYTAITVYYQGNLVWGTPPSGASEAESMEITQQPITSTAGDVISPSPTVLLEDGLGNPVEGIEVTVTLNQNSFAGGSTTTVLTNASGLAVFDDLTIENADTGYELTFDPDASLVSNLTSNSFNVTPDDAANRTVSTQPASSTTAGTTLSPAPAVTITDTYGNPVPNVDVTVNLNQNSFASGTTTVSTNSSGVASFNDLVITTAATGYQFTFDTDAAGVTDITSNTFAITPDAATTMTITQQPLESVDNGNVEGPPAVTLTDTYGNPVPNIDVTVSETGGYTFDGGTLTQSTNTSGIATFSDLSITTSNTGYQLTFNADAAGVSNVNSSVFDVVSAGGSMSVTTQPTQTVAGNVMSPSPAVKLVDSGDIPISGVDITISLNKNGFDAGTLTRQTNSSGIATFDDLEIETADTGYQITFNADEPGVANISSNNFEVIAANPAALSLQTQPGSSVAGSSITGPPAVILTDAYSNPVSGVDITVTVNQNSFASGTTTLSTDTQGIAEFDDLVITTATTGYQLTFDPDASGVSSILSNNFAITAASANSMSITVQPTETSADVLLSPAPKVEVVDAYNNPVNGKSITASLNQNSFSGGSTSIVSTNSSGVATFSNLKIGTVASNYQITFSGTGLSSVSSNTFNIVQPDPPFGSIRLQYENHATNNISSTIQPYLRLYNDSSLDINLSDLTVRYWFSSEPTGNDQFNADWVEMGSPSDVTGTFDQLEGATNYFMEMGFSSSAVIPIGLGGDGSTPDLMPSGATTGIIQLRLANGGAGDYDQSNDYSFDSGITTYTDYQDITVYYQGELIWGTPPEGTAAAESMEITQQPANGTAGSVLSPSPAVLLEDGVGDPVEGVDVTVSLNKNNFTAGSTTIVTTNASGLAIFDDLTIEDADTGYELTFDADADLVTNKTSNTFDIDPAAAANSSVSVQPPSSNTAGSTLSPSPAVTITDAYGNSVPNIDITVSLNQNTFASGTTTISTNSSGVATFSDLVINTAATGYQLTFDTDAAGVSNITSTTFTITAAVANSMSITQQPQESVVNGVITGPPAVKLVDAYNNPVTGIDVTVSETGGYTFDGGTLTRTTNSSGVATFNDLAITTANTDYRLTFDPDAFGVSNLNSNLFDVVMPSGSMSVTSHPAETVAGQTISPSPAVELLDGVGDPLSGVDITITLNKNGFDAGTLTKQTNGSGIATFDDLVIETADTDYEITFDADQSGVANVFSTAFDVTTAAPTTMSVTTPPETTPAESAISGPPAVTISDTYGNPVAGVDVTVSLNQNSFSSGTTTVATSTSGISEFSDLIISTIATGYQLTFDADTAGVSNVTSSSFNITADAPDAMEITVQPTETTGSVTISPSPRVLVTDANDNPVPGVNVTVSINKNTFAGGSTVIVSTNSSGLAIFSNLKINTADTGYEMTFSASGLTDVTSNQFEITQPNPPYGSIRLEYENNSTNTSSATISPYMRVTNDSDYNINLSDLTIRYWFSSEPTGTDVFNAYWVEMGDVSELTSSFDTEGGNYFLEIGFTSSADIPSGLGGNSVANEMPPDATTGRIEATITNNGSGNYDQSDDYSFDASVTSYADYQYINVYYKGQLVWGISPPISSKFYSRQTGNWGNASNWSQVSHSGAVSTVAPAAEDTIVIGDGHVISFTENIANDESITIDATGTLATGSYILSGDGDFALSANGTLRIGSADGISSSGSSGNIQNTGTRSFNQGANYVYNGSSAQQTGNGLPTTLSGDLTINNSAGVTHSTNLEITGTLNLSNGSLIIPSGNNLIANTKNITGGDLILEHTITGSTGWRLLSSPIASTYGDLLDNTVTQGYSGAYYPTGSNPGDTLQPNVMYYDETYATNSSGGPATDNQRWRAPSSASASIPEGQGMYTFFFGDIDADPLYNDLFDFPINLTVQGQENDGNGTEVDLGVTYTPQADSGWNLVGNPYAATIDWDDTSEWTKTNMDNVIYVWDPGTSSFKTWNGSAGDLTSQGLIAPFQGFWVKANDANPELKVTKEAKTTGGIYVGKIQEEQESNPDLTPVLSFKLSDGEIEASTHFMFSGEAKIGKDPMDAYSLLPPPGIHTYLDINSLTEDGNHFSINNLPRQFGKTIEIPIYVEAYENGYSVDKTMKMSLDKLENIPEGWFISLVDNKSKAKIDLTHTSTFSFSQKGSKSYSTPNKSLGTKPKITARQNQRSPRFTLMISPGEDAVNLPENVRLEQNYPNPFNPSTKIQFDLPVQSYTELSIFDMLGRSVATLIKDELSAGTHTIEWDASRLSSGVYIYRLVTNQTSVTKKMTLIK